MDSKALRLTIDEVLILAAASLPLIEFGDAELTVAVWNLDPKRFGLRGYWQSHPDHKMVTAAVCHRTGLVKRDCLRRLRPCVLSLTEKGIALAGDVRRKLRLRAAG